MSVNLSISLPDAIIYTLFMKIIFIIAAGGAIGSVGRYAVTVGVDQWAGLALLRQLLT